MASSGQDRNRARFYALGGVFLLWLATISGRLVEMQVVRYAEFAQRARRQHQRTVEVAPRRGVIYDRNGDALAMSIQVDSIFAVPSEIPDHETAAALLGRVLKTDPKSIVSRLKSSSSFAWMARKVDAQVSERVRALNLRGIYFEKESRRFYPKRELASQVLGWVGMDDEGLGGIEYAYDEQLRGESGQMLISVDARRRWFGRDEQRPQPGGNVVLTLDEKIQYIAERELQRAITETGAHAGTIIVQKPQTGEILALANWPTFNPNDVADSSARTRKNRAITDIYEPGSTFKVVTLSAALEERVTTPEETIDCQNGAIYIGRHRIRDHKPYGILTVREVLANSSGVGTIKLGLRLGEERLDHYLRAFGFGSPTGIELPGETRGMTRPPSQWSQISIGAVSIGQEVGVSALQVADMVSTVANDGVWVRPRIVAGVLPPRESPQTLVVEPSGQRRVISTLTAARMKKMLEGVVLFGTGRKAILDGYTSAGKTGTAQKADVVHGGYSRTDYVASFVGFAPLNEPAITVAVILDSPKGRMHEGGQVAAPVFARVAQQVLAYSQVPEDVEPRQRRERLLRAAAPNEALAEGSPDRFPPTLEIAEAPASPPATQDVAPDKTEASADGGTVVVELEDGIVVPSLVGKPLREVIQIAQRAGLDIDVIGSGVAREQQPPPGVRIAPGSRVAVRFAR